MCDSLKTRIKQSKRISKPPQFFKHQQNTHVAPAIMQMFILKKKRSNDSNARFLQLFQLVFEQAGHNLINEVCHAKIQQK